MLTFVFGTRPEAIKIGPIVAALHARGVPVRVVSTGQHTTLLYGTPAETDLVGAISLGLHSTGNVTTWVQESQAAVTDACEGSSVIVVQGDTMSALVGARAGHALGIPVAHVEAGVRSGSLTDPWPEEGYRREITQRATWHYAPTQTCVQHLLSEGVGLSQIRLTGNTVVSALHRYAALDLLPTTETIVVTLHRREFTKRKVFDTVLRAINTWCKYHPRFTVLYPQHPSTPPLDFYIQHNFRVCLPQHYADFTQTLRGCWGVLSDSGGVVEECATLGVPVAVLRTVTDRPEAEDAGIAKRFPTTPAGAKAALHWLWHDPPRGPRPVYGGPDAASLIADHLTFLLD